jgi:hypothetical protein
VADRTWQSLFRRDHRRTTEQSLSPIGSGLALTLIAWLLSRIAVGAAWGPARNPFTFQPTLWWRVDSFNYLVIAGHGRTFGLCGSPGFPRGFGLYSHFKWCGSAGWLPGYPWLMAIVHSTGISLPDAGVIVAWLAMATAIFLVWLGWARSLPFGHALVLLILFGLFPGAVYSFAIFPTSIALAFVVGAIFAATRERFFLAAILMTLAGLCYPSAWYAAAGLAAGLVLLAGHLGRYEIVRRAFWGFAGLSSLLILGIMDQLAFGHANAYLLIQDHGSTFSFGRLLLRTVFARSTLEQKRMGKFGAGVLSLQAVIAIGLPAAAVAMVGRAWRRGERNAADVYPALVGAIVILGMVISGTAGTWYRSVVLAAPSVVCLRRLSFPTLCVLTGVVAIVTAIISRAFFNLSLI